jgi:hypothetical protein
MHGSVMDADLLILSFSFCSFSGNSAVLEWSCSHREVQLD